MRETSNFVEHRPTILVDLDSTVCDLLTPWLEAYNSSCDDSLRIEDLRTFNTHNHAKHGRRIYETFDVPGFFAGLPPLPGAIEAVKELHRDAEVVIVTSASSYAGVMGDKALWVKKHLPFLSLDKNFIITGAKHLVRGRVLIDDAPHNAEAFNLHWPDALTMGIAFPYNEEHERHFCVLARDWKDTAKAWDQILSEIYRRIMFVRRGP